MSTQQPSIISGDKEHQPQPFCFKQFSVDHLRSAMRVGVDGVLIGAWADVSGLPATGVALDAGCGCGMIALMVAQRWKNGHVIGMDIHEPSVREAMGNVASSPWADRVCILQGDVMSIAENDMGPLSLIVSNPPFFSSGIAHPDTPRLVARHACEFGPLTLPAIGMRLLMPRGRLALIAPAEMEQDIRVKGDEYGLSVRRICRVVTVAGKSPSRVMIEMEKSIDVTEMEQTLVIHDNKYEYTAEYKLLTGDFYLNFQTD